MVDYQSETIFRVVVVSKNISRSYGRELPFPPDEDSPVPPVILTLWGVLLGARENKKK